MTGGQFSCADPLRRWKDVGFQAAALLGILLAIAVLAVLLWDTLIDALPRLGWDFLTGFPSRKAHKAGVQPALLGSIYLMLLTGLISAPLGVGAAIYLEEYAPVNRLTRLIELNLANLAGVPSVVYGLLGLQIFVRTVNLDRSLLSGALTLSLLILPIVILGAREALRAVPASIRHGARALGATQWQAIWGYVLPLAAPGMLTAIILAFSRAIGETAPLITIGAVTFISGVPTSPMSEFTALPIQAFNWMSDPRKAFHENSAAAIVVLMTLLLLLNAGAIWLRSRMQRRLAW